MDNDRGIEAEANASAAAINSFNQQRHMWEAFQPWPEEAFRQGR
jgi:hypothetical protein